MIRSKSTPSVSAVLRKRVIRDDHVPRARRERHVEGGLRLDAVDRRNEPAAFEFADYQRRVVHRVFDEQDRQTRARGALRLPRQAIEGGLLVTLEMRAAVSHDNGSPSAVLQAPPTVVSRHRSLVATKYGGRANCLTTSHHRSWRHERRVGEAHGACKNVVRA